MPRVHFRAFPGAHSQAFSEDPGTGLLPPWRLTPSTRTWAGGGWGGTQSNWSPEEAPFKFSTGTPAGVQPKLGNDSDASVFCFDSTKLCLFIEGFLSSIQEMPRDTQSWAQLTHAQA